jgi:hypothetical protein
MGAQPLSIVYLAARERASVCPVSGELLQRGLR